MKRLIVALIFAMTATAAWAACTTQTIFLPGGGMMICTTCCSFGHCTTSCV